MENETFKEFLSNIYGEKIFNSLVNNEKSGVYSLKSKADLEEAFIKSKDGISDKKSCQICKAVYDAIKPSGKEFIYRNMDFPSWLGEINEKDECKKKIMILGESVTGSLKKIESNNKPYLPHLNIAWHLGYKIYNDTDFVNLKPKSPFWKKFGIFFGNSFPKIIKELYISDVAFCSCDKKQLLYLTCSSNYLKKQINLINPKLLITLGNDANLAVLLKSNVLPWKFTPIEVKFDLPLRRKYYEEYNIRAGTITRNKSKDSILYLNLPHTTKGNTLYSDKIWKIITEKIRKIKEFQDFFSELI